MDTVAGWVAAAGTPRLAQALLHGMQHKVPVAFCFVFLAPPTGAARLVDGASLHGKAAMRAAEQYFGRGFERFDVNTRLLAARRVRTRRSTMLTLQTVEQIEDGDYRRACYDEPGVHSRASVVVALPEHGHAAVNFYRTLALPRFTRDELDVLAQCSALLGAVVAQHMRLLDYGRPARDAAPLVHGLSARERQIIEAILQGRTTKMIARDTGLAATTVNTYRYRAFRRLGIRREKELFALLRPQSATSW